MPLFIQQFNDYITCVLASSEETIFLGDFNLHVHKPDDFYSVAFRELCETFDLEQHVRGPTHEQGNTLDLVISRNPQCQ